MAKGDPLTVSDATSVAQFGPIANALGWPKADLLLENDADVERLIREVLNQQKNDYIGVSSISVDADQDPVHLFGILSTMASHGIGATAVYNVHWEHPAGDSVDFACKMIGCHFVITMEGGQAKMTGEIRSAANQGPANSAQVWATATSYVANQYVTDAGVLYQCLVSHTSGTDEDEPGVGAEWTDWWVQVA